MPRRLSPLGTPLNYPDEPALPKAAVVGARLGPHGLPLPALSSGPDVYVTLTGAGANAEGGNVSVGLPAASRIGQLGPLGLPTPIRGAAAKVGDVSVQLVGAVALAQGEELEGANVTIYLDGATAFAQASRPVGASEITDIDIEVEAEDDTVMVASEAIGLVEIEAESDTAVTAAEENNIVVERAEIEDFED